MATTKKAKSRNAKIKDLLIELRYYQTLNRVDARILEKGREKCRKLGRELRELKNGNRK